MRPMVLPARRARAVGDLQDRPMVFIWSSGWGPRRRRRGPGYRHGTPYGYGRRYGYGYGYGPRRGYDRDGSCLRDLLFLNTGCCLANAIGCGIDGLFLVPTTVRHVHAAGTGRRGTRVRDRLVAAVRVYQREVSPRRPPCCRFEPTCSAYAGGALEQQDRKSVVWGKRVDLGGRRTITKKKSSV